MAAILDFCFLHISCKKIARLSTKVVFPNICRDDFVGQPFTAGHVCFPKKWWFGSYIPGYSYKATSLTATDENRKPGCLTSKGDVVHLPRQSCMRPGFELSWACMGFSEKYPCCDALRAPSHVWYLSLLLLCILKCPFRMTSTFASLWNIGGTANLILRP